MLSMVTAYALAMLAYGTFTYLRSFSCFVNLLFSFQRSTVNHSDAPL